MSEALHARFGKHQSGWSGKNYRFDRFFMLIRRDPDRAAAHLASKRSLGCAINLSKTKNTKFGWLSFDPACCVPLEWLNNDHDNDHYHQYGGHFVDNSVEFGRVLVGIRGKGLQPFGVGHMKGGQNHDSQQLHQKP